jgi:chemotaxis signal transduction protein
MTMEESIDQQVQRLRREFDESFTQLQTGIGERGTDFVVLVCGSVRYVVALSEIALLQGDTRIVRVPSSNPRLLGVCSVRGELLAVFSLAACLGKEARESPMPWILRAAATTTAFAFDRCEGQVRGVVQSISARERVVMCEGTALPILPLSGVVAKVHEEGAAEKRRREMLNV